MACGSCGGAARPAVPLTSADYVSLYEPITAPDDGSTPEEARYKVTDDDTTADVTYFRSYDAAAGWQDGHGGRLRKV
jgi:hypothetical protein